MEQIRTVDRSYKVYGDVKRIYRSSLPYIRSGRRYSPIQKQWYKRVMRLRHFRHSGFSGGYKYKKDAVQIGRLTEQLAYLFEHDITSKQDIQNRLSNLEKVRGRESASERKLLKGICSTYEQSQQPDDIIFDPEAH